MLFINSEQFSKSNKVVRMEVDNFQEILYKVSCNCYCQSQINTEQKKRYDYATNPTYETTGKTGGNSGLCLHSPAFEYTTMYTQRPS